MNEAFLLIAFRLALAAQSAAPTHAPSAHGLSAIHVYPAQISLTTARDSQSVIVQAEYADGITRDVTDKVTWKLDHEDRVTRSGNLLRPKADGDAKLMVAFESQATDVPITVKQAAVDPPISFKLDVMPVFMRAGCNVGSCHGSSRGKDGFHLSLFGFDPDGDYYRLTREQIGRRINLGIPEESLIVQKGLGAVQHTGGVRFGTNSDLCRTLIGWLAAGAPKDPTNVAKVTGIEIFPKSAVLEGSNTVQRFIVRARYSDGNQRDVTPLAVFLSNNDVTAQVAEDG